MVGRGLPRLPGVAGPVTRPDRASRPPRGATGRVASHGVREDMPLSSADERRSGSDRRAGQERRSGMDRRVDAGRIAQGQRLMNRPVWVGNTQGIVGWETEPGGAFLQRVFPHAPFNEREAAARSAAIAAHRQDLGARLGRNVDLSVAALDYLLTVTGDLVAPSIVEHDVLHVLEHRSVTDPLTGLFNRYHFETTLRREVARCLRHKTRLSLLLMDVDQLKAVNDRWGHQAGDRVLGRVAGAIQKSLRDTDIASRYGGDEFAIILPDTAAGAGRLVAERVCANVGASVRDGIVPDAATRVTVSGGLVELSRAAGRTSEAQLIVAADQALYQAKGRGGNCVADVAASAGAPQP